ncbi:hypothetical protein DMA11_16425 [Marinilabiliaceae bacterium JC017]|nr:hypothetical protein DMA11_16425 [Marinilabiliaceae bacterium JC017]
MKQIIIFSIFMLVLGSSCNRKPVKSDSPQKTIITGRIIDYSKDQTEITLVNMDLLVTEKREVLDIDSTGFFSYSFMNNSPRDIRLKGNSVNFLFLAFPGDSIHVEFKSRTNDYQNSIAFSGDRHVENKQVTHFQHVFNNSSVSHKEIVTAKAKFDLPQFLHFMDSVQKVSMSLVDSFVKENATGEIVSGWIKWYASEPYLYNMSWYPNERDDIQVPQAYYDFQNELLPLNRHQLCATYNIDLFVSEYFHGTIMQGFLQDNRSLLEKWQKDESLYKQEELKADSLVNEAIIKYSNGEIIKELVFTNYYADKISSGNLRSYAHFQSFLNQQISTEFLKASLENYFNTVKERIERPLTANQLVNSINSGSIQATLDTLFNANKGKVLVFDCWGTYCGSCIANFPKMKNIMEKLNGQDIRFVFFCLDGDSNKQRFQNLIKTYELDGKHYCLNKKENKDLRQMLQINGIPHYAVFDKKGQLRKNGNFLPGEEELLMLLNE